MTRDEFIERCIELQACHEAMTWLKALPKTVKTAQQIWERCNRADWMYWYLGQTSKFKTGDKTHKRVVSSACDCAELSFKYIKDKEQAKATKNVIKTTRAWIRGRATLAEVRNAASAYAASAASDAYAASAAYAAYAAAAYDAYAYAAYAADAAAKRARDKLRAKCASVVRKHFPKVPGIAVDNLDLNNQRRSMADATP